MSNQITLKQSLHKLCRERLQAQIQSLETALASVQESLESETKSTAGDKYETGRAMLQLEEEKFQMQLSSAAQTLTILEGIDARMRRESAELGSLVLTDTGKYYLAVGLGKINLEGELYYVISPDSPIGRELLHKRAGDQLQFNRQRITILSIS